MDSDEWLKALAASSESWPEMAQRAVRECPSVKVWSRYAELLIQHAPERALPALDHGVQQVGLWIDSSHHFWALYVSFLKLAKPSDIVVKAYEARLAVPHLALDETYTELSTYVSGNDNYEEIMTRASRVVARTRRLLAERERWELAKPLRFEEYLEWELERFSANARFDFCVPLFNRILTATPRCNTALWVRFVQHMWFYHPEEAWLTVERALIYYPAEPQLWTLKTRIACDQKDRERVREAIRGAEQAGLNIVKNPGLLSAYSAWLVNSEVTSPPAIRELRMLVEPVIFSPFVPLDQLAVLAEVLSNANEIEIARKAWRKRAAATSQDSDLWEAWVTFELGLGRKEKVEGLIKLWKLHTHLRGAETHPFVRRNVHRVLVANLRVAEAEKVELAGETTVWVTRLPKDCDNAAIRSKLQVFGPIDDVRRPPNRDFCYVQFATHDAARRAAFVGVEGLHIQLSNRSHKVRPPQDTATTMAAAPRLLHAGRAKRSRELENTLVFAGMQDSTDEDRMKELLASYKGAQLGEFTSQGSESQLTVAFASDADAGRAQLAFSGILLPSGASLRVSYT